MVGSLINNELESIWQLSGCALIEVLCLYLHGRAEENQDKPQDIR
jgi:hypothetical protein